MKNGDEKNFVNVSHYFNLKSVTGQSAYDYELGKLKYLIRSNKITGCNVNDYKLYIDYSNININGSKAIVDIIVKYDISDNWIIDNYETNKYHEITLHNANGKWLIENDFYSDEFKDLYPIGTDFDAMISKLSERNALISDNKVTVEPAEKTTPYIVPGDYYATYDRKKAQSYAYTTEGGYEGTSYNNAQFKYFTYQNDCQNFVSQCVWAGFGGTSTTSISYPMETNWWANTQSTSTTWNWTSASAFLSYITTNYNNDTYYRVQGTASTIPNYMEIGDYIYVPGHVMVVTEANDSNGNGIIDYNEIKISAHTWNHLNYPLYKIYGAIIPEDMQFVKIRRIRCNNGTPY